MCKVVIKHTPSYDSMTVYHSVKEIMLQQRINLLIKPDSRILIKPNMLSKQVPSKCVTTHPAVLDAVIMVLKEFGANPQNMLIADSSGGPSSASILQANYNACGFSLIGETHGVPVYTKLKSQTVKTHGALVKEFDLISPFFQYDLIFNLAKFKTHVMTGMSGAVKNLFGLVPGLKKAEFHMRFPNKEHFAHMLVDLCETVKPAFTIIDGVMGMDGDGPAGGNPKQIGMLIAGTNPYYIDSVLCYLMGFDVMAVPVMQAAIARGLVPQKLPCSAVVGDTWLYQKIENFQLPASYSIDFQEKMPRAISWATPVVEKLVAPRPKIIKNRCIGCGKCKDICPQHVISISNKKAQINLSGCIKCFCCHEMCPAKAIAVKRSSFFDI